MPRILPLYDAELTRPVGKRLGELGIEVLTGAKAKGLSPKGDALLVETADGKDAQIAGRQDPGHGRPQAASPKAGASRNSTLDMAGQFIRIDDQCRTSMRGVYAIGDVTGEPMLAHRAMAQGEMVAEIVAGHKRSWDKRCIPAVCFTDPGDRHRRPVAGRGAGRRARDQDRRSSRSRPTAAP